MSNLVADIGRSRDYYKGKSIDFAGLWTPGIRYFNDDYITNFVVYAEKDDDGKIKASKELSSGISKIFALAENYPELKANTNFVDLQNQLKDVEEKISYARQFYNDSVLIYNNKIEMFPSNIVASIFHFTKESFFEASTEEKENVKVQF